MENIEPGTGIYESSTDELVDFGTAIRFSKGQVLFPKLRPYLNKTHFTTFEGYCSTEFYVLEAIKCSPEYLFTFLNSNLVVDQTSCLMTGNTLPRLQTEDVEQLLIPLLDSELQIRISKLFFTALSNKSKKYQVALKIVHSIDSTVAKTIGFNYPQIEPKPVFKINLLNFESRFDPHFYLPGFKALIDNIRKINNAQLGGLVEFSNETWNQKDGFENEFPYIEISEIDLTSGKIQNISYTPISEAPSRAKMIVRTNDIIVSTTRPHRGAIAFINQEQNGFIASTGFVVLRKFLRSDVNRDYLFYILRTQICLQQMLQRSSGGSYPAITAEELRKIYIPIPSPAIQQQIVLDIKTFIDKAEALKAGAKQDLEKAKLEIETLILS